MTPLFDEFPPVTASEWEAAVSGDLEGPAAGIVELDHGRWHRRKAAYTSADLAGIEPRQLYSSRNWKIACEVSDLESARYAISRGAAALYAESGDIGGFRGC